MYHVQAKLELGDGQRSALMACHRRYRGALGALAKERVAINAALANAAAPGKDGAKKVLLSSSAAISPSLLQQHESRLCARTILLSASM
jgi:hypothetical protein